MHHSPDFSGLQSLILNRLTKELSGNLHYHDFEHTKDVVESILTISSGEGITNENDLLILKTAALMHDTGFLKSYDDHEQRSCELAVEILPEYGYSSDQIDAIKKIILATKMPQNPQTHFERIICDADLDYLGREDYGKIAERLFLELKSLGKVTSREEWVEIQSDFLSNHTYWTDHSQNIREDVKQNNLRRILNFR